MDNSRTIKLGFLISLVFTVSPPALGDDIELANAPLFVSATADPNVMFILDDSGSMQWGFIPDGLIDDFNIGEFSEENCDGTGEHAGVFTCFYSIDGRRFAASNETNPIYYDPNEEYVPPLNADGDPYPNAEFDSAWVDGYAAQGEDDPETVNLENDYRAIMDDYFWKRIQDVEVGEGIVDIAGFTVGSTVRGDSGERAFYYEFEGGTGCSARPYPDSCFGERQHPDTDELQNFANWFSYYRNRILAARAAITAAFIDQPEDMRVGYDAIDNHRNEINEVERGVRPFTDDPGSAYDDDSTFRSDFFDWLQTAEARGATPLRNALMASGRYYEDSSDTGPWASAPGVTDGEEVDEFLECRPSVSILMTDGYWNEDLESSVGNVDDTSTESISGPGDRFYPGYTPQSPFSDGYSDTLADVAMHFWIRDLQPDIEKRVPIIESSEDEEQVPNPAFWQHMSTYGIGFGVTGSVDPDDAFAAIETGDPIDWPDPHPEENREAKIDDLLHAAVNSRGGFFSTSDPNEFSTQLSEQLSDFMEQIGASTGVTFDTATLEEDSLIFAAQFDSTDWTGDLFASPLLSNDEDESQVPEIGDEIWSAADKLDARDLEASPREIITSDGSQGIAFRWSDELNETQKADLKRFGGDTEQEREETARARVDYLRGDRSMEGEDGEFQFRTRGSRLGDIVNSTPVRVSSPSSGWPNEDPFGEGGTEANNFEDGNRYSDFRAEQDGRTPVIYTGANDGMLHGFNATEDGGDEVLAFMPSAIFSSEAASGLHYLTRPGYSHRYYVDLPPLVADAFTRGRNEDGSVQAEPDWRTVLLGGSRTGENAIFALDITDPERFDEANAAELMLWEFTAEDDDRMGKITEPPVIALADWDRRNNQNDYRWTAFFGNGYNSPVEATGIFMLDLEGGLDGNWDEDDDYRFIEFRGEGDGNVTGLSPVAVYDDSGDGIADRVYGGDLDGNMWVADADGGGIGEPDTYRLFVAEDGQGERQSITAAPLVIKDTGDDDDSDAGRLVLLGTGQYLNTTDLSDTQTQSLYAVRDAGTSLTRGNLAQRSLSQETGGCDDDATGNELVLCTVDDEASSGDGWYVDLFAEGERITLSPQVRGDFIFATSSIPSDNPCVAGGESRNMAFGLDGRTPDIPVFTGFDEAVVSFRMEEGIASQAAFLGDFMFTPTSTGDVGIEGIDTGVPDNLLGRQGWQELIE